MFNPLDLVKSFVESKLYAQNSHEKVKSTYYNKIATLDFHTHQSQHDFTGYFNDAHSNMYDDHKDMFS